jgi:hypothetical protein
VEPCPIDLPISLCVNESGVVPSSSPNFGRLGDMHINKDGSKTMNGDDQKIVHRWNHEVEKPTWVTQSSANIGDVLDHLKLGLDDGTTPDSLIHKDIGKSVGHGFSKFVNPLNFVF